jgi:hypothetical protein
MSSPASPGDDDDPSGLKALLGWTLAIVVPLAIAIAVPILCAGDRRGGVNGIEAGGGFLLWASCYPLFLGARGLWQDRAILAETARRFGGPLPSFSDVRPGQAALVAGKLVEGRAAGLVGPITGKPCVYARACAVEQRDHALVVEETAGDTLVLEDGAGQRATVILEGGTVVARELRFRETSGGEIREARSPAAAAFLARHGVTADRPITFQETALVLGQTVLVRGRVRRGDADPYRGEGREGTLVLEDGPGADERLVVHERTSEELLELVRPRVSIGSSAELLIGGLFLLALAAGSFAWGHDVVDSPRPRRHGEAPALTVTAAGKRA